MLHASLALLLSVFPAPHTAPPVHARQPLADEELAELVRAGRLALEAGRTAEARALFERARAEDSAAPALGTWLLRIDIAEGRHELALEGAERLARAGLRADADYIAGWASLGMALSSLDARNTDASIGYLLADAQGMLARALASDAERFADAWPALAEAAWRNGDLLEAERAVSAAVARASEDAGLQALAGRIASGRYQELQAASAASAEATRTRAVLAFERCVELLGAPQDPDGERALAEAWMQLGRLRAWGADAEGAQRGFLQAMACDPASVDFREIRTALGAEPFAAATAEAAQSFAERHPERDPRSATLAWWDGWSHFETKDFEHAAASYRSAVELWPAYTDSWYWLWRIELARERQSAALAALRTYWKADSSSAVLLLTKDAAAEAARLEGLVGWCADPAKHGGRPVNAEAVFLCELLSELQPDQARHWNNLGLFLRDQGEVQHAAGKEDTAAELWERSLAAYERSLALEPESPAYLNDTAVILHYYLQRDLERARQMYEQAARLAAAALERQDLAADERESIATALRDSRDNLRRLDAWRAQVEAGVSKLDPQSVR